MATINLTVYYDAQQTPPVWVIPDQVDIDNNQEDTLIWSPQSGATWTLSAIQQKDGTALPNPPFSDVTVSASQISATDDNTSSVDHGSWSYKVAIVVNGQTIWSDPQIINKGGG